MFCGIYRICARQILYTKRYRNRQQSLCTHKHKHKILVLESTMNTFCSFFFCCWFCVSTFWSRQSNELWRKEHWPRIFIWIIAFDMIKPDKTITMHQFNCDRHSGDFIVIYFWWIYRSICICRVEKNLKIFTRFGAFAKVNLIHTSNISSKIKCLVIYILWFKQNGINYK